MRISCDSLCVVTGFSILAFFSFPALISRVSSCFAEELPSFLKQDIFCFSCRMVVYLEPAARVMIGPVGLSVAVVAVLFRRLEGRGFVREIE